MVVVVVVVLVLVLVPARSRSSRWGPSTVANDLWNFAEARGAHTRNPQVQVGGGYSAGKLFNIQNGQFK